MKPIAVIGLGCRFPGASAGPDSFWKLLVEGQSAISEVPSSRWEIGSLYSEATGTPGKMNSRRGGFLDDVKGFDSSFFKITPTEADSMDPQQRILLEVAYETFEHAGIPVQRVAGTRVGVFVGISNSDYSRRIFEDPEGINTYSLTGAAPSLAANRISYVFDFRGPSLSVDTACSSSLTAIQLACESLNRGESELALAGGVNLILTPSVSIGYAQAHASSPDGVCRAFDARANGAVRGEGAGWALLKPLAQALADGDRVLAVVRGTAITQDGATNGITAPNPLAQRELLKSAYLNAGVDPASVSFIETHGTGTPLGDPIEAKAIGQVLAPNRSEETPCLIGSVKTNIGHLEAAAGIAGFIKAVLSLSRRTLPQSLGFEQPNRLISFKTLKLAVPCEPQKLDKKGPIFGGVSSFGFGGTNVHVVLESPPELASLPRELPPSESNLLVLSARSEQSLRSLALKYHRWISERPDLTPTQIVSSVHFGRDVWEFRAGIAFCSRAELISELDQLARGEGVLIECAFVAKPSPERRPVAFVFPGMGSQKPGMGKELLKIREFREAIEACDRAMASELNWSVLDHIRNSSSNDPELGPDRAQPLLFSFQMGLVALWKAAGIEPDLVLGSSMGEVAAAASAGLLSLEDAARVVCRRIQAISRKVGTGSVAAVNLPNGELKKFLADRDLKVWIAAENSPTLSLLTGIEADIDRVVSDLKTAGTFARKIKGASAPSHCPLMEDIGPELVERLRGLSPQDPKVPMISTVYTRPLQRSEAGPEYWKDNVLRPILFRDAVGVAEKSGHYIYVEIGAHPVLSAAVFETLMEVGNVAPVVVPTLRDVGDERDFRSAHAAAVAAGAPFDWASRADFSLKLESLPTYSWQHETHWIEEVAKIAPARPAGVGPQVQLPELEAYLIQNVARVLKRNPTQIDPAQPLKSMGIGSLMGMELYSRLKRDFKISLSASRFLSGPSIQEIAREIQRGLEGSAPGFEITPVAISSRMPLSFGQKRFWFLQQLEPGASVFNSPTAIRVQGLIDPERISIALAKICERHAILMATYHSDNGEPYLVPNSTNGFELEILDLSSLPETLRDEDALTAARASADQVFSLSSGPLLRALLIKLRPEDWILVVTMHHIVTDGGSLQLLFNELFSFYREPRDHPPSGIDPLPFQYWDFSAWQERKIRSPEFERGLKFWRQKLANVPPLLEFSHGPAEARALDYTGDAVEFRIAKKKIEALEQFAQSQGCTPFMVLLSAFQVLLWRLSGQKDFVVGTPIAGRQEPGTEKLIGVFLNMLPLRASLEPGQSFRHLLAQVRTTVLEAFDHQEVPFEKLVEELQPERNLGRSPLFQVAIALHAPVDNPATLGLSISHFPLGARQSQFDLTLSFLPSDAEFIGTLEFKVSRFSREFAESIQKTFLAILDGALLSPERTISELELLDPETRAATRTLSFGPIQSLPEQTVTDLFATQVSTRPDALAVQDESKGWTYKEIDQRADEICDLIRARGIESADPIVAVAIDRSAEMVAAWIAIWKAGGRYLPIDPRTPLSRNLTILAQARPDLILTSSSGVGGFSVSGFPTLSTAEVAPQQVKHGKGHRSSGAYVLFTSGSTGTPKGVEISHRALLNLALWHQRKYEISLADRASQIASPSFDAAGWEIWPYLISGASLHFVPDEVCREVDRLPRWFEDQRISHGFLPTPLLEALIVNGWTRSKNFRAVLTGGARLGALPPHDLPVFNHYGPTEATVVSTACRVSKESIPSATGRPAIGRPISNSRALILDERHHLLPIGFSGSIWVSGEILSEGYLHAPELTQQKFRTIPHEGTSLWYQTGDIGYQTSDGNLHFIGREDEQIKIRGMRIEPAEIERVLRDRSGIHALTVLSRKSTSGDPELAAFWVAQPHGSGPSLRDLAIEHLPAQMVPALYFEVSKIPLTPSGKVDARRLWELGKATGPEVETPTGLIDRRLSEIWNQVLGTRPTSPSAHFFEAGGHSLLALQFVGLVSKQFQVVLPLKSIFEQPTFGGIAANISALENSRGTAASFPSQFVSHPEARFEPFPLTDVQQAYWVGRQGRFQVGGITGQSYIELELTHFASEAFESAIRRLVARHDMLRAVVSPDGTQRIVETVPPFKLDVSDLSDLNSNSQEARLAEIRSELSQIQRRTDQWPLFDIRASRLNASRTRLHLNFDGLIVDASSLKILSDELGALYRDPALELPPIAASFRDYVLAVEELTQSSQVAESQAYWRSRVPTIPNGPDLPLICDPKTLDAPRFSRLSLTLSGPEWKGLQEKARAMGLTATSVILTAFSDVLGRWSRSPRFTVNLTLFNRVPLHPEIDRMVGDFTSLTLLEIDTSLGLGFSESVKKVQNQLLSDLEHRLPGGVWVQRELARERGLDAAAMPVVFTSLVGLGSVEPPPSLGKLVASSTQTPQVWIDHQVYEMGDSLVSNWDFPLGLFSNDTIQSMFRTFESRLRSLGDTDWGGRIPLELPESELLQRREANDTRVVRTPQTLHASFFQNACKHGDAVAVETSSGRTSYASLAQAADQLGSALLLHSVQPGERVGVCVRKGLEVATATLAVLRAGGAFLPLDPDSPPNRLLKIIEDSDLRLIVSDESLEGVGIPHGVSLISVHARNPVESPPLWPVVDPKTLAYVIYTSGSTGKPKGVMITHDSAMNTIEAVNRLTSTGPSDRVFGISELHFDLSVWDLFGTFSAGATLVLPDPGRSRDPAHWSELGRDTGITVWNSVPALMEMLVEYSDANEARFPKSLRSVLLSGDWIPKELPVRLRKLLPQAQLLSLGGATEASIWSISHPMDQAPAGVPSIPYGTPLPNQIFHCKDEYGDDRPVGVPGMLYIGGEGLALGYLNDPKKTSESFVTEPISNERLYRTGDFGRYLKDGSLEFLGRQDLQVKIGGSRIEIGEIESILSMHPSIQACAVTVVDMGSHRKHLAAHVVTRTPIHSQSLIEFATSHLPASMIPRTWNQIPNLPLSANGKVDRQQLANHVSLVPNERKLAIRSGLLDQILELISQTVGLSKLQPDSDLLALGVNSVDFVRLANRLEREFGSCPSVSDLFRLKTPADLAAFYDSRDSKKENSPALAPATDPEEFKRTRAIPRSVPAITKLWERTRETPLRLESTREFAKTPVAAESVGKLLECLAQLDKEHARFRYASAGGTYPVETFISVSKDRVSGLQEGLYRYWREVHGLERVSSLTLPHSELHLFGNLSIAKESAFCIFFFADRSAIEPVYREKSLTYSQFEAGSMAQLLRQSAGEHQLGMCLVSEVNFLKMRHALNLPDHFEFLQAALCGPLIGSEADWEEFRV